MRVLITGGAGYIGGAVSAELLNRGHQVLVFDRMFFGYEAVKELMHHPNFAMVQADVRAPDHVNQFLPKAEAVVHLAALVGEPAALKWPQLNVGINIMGTMNIVQEIEDKHLIYASSCSVYGNQQGIVDEDSPVEALGPYAQSRLTSEQNIISQVKNYTILRLSTAFGLSKRMRFDLLVNDFTLSAFRTGQIEVYNPSIVRPFVHIKDIARAIAQCLERPEAKGQIINIGRENLSKQALAETVAGITNAEIKLVKSKTRDNRNYTVSFKKAEELLGFTGQISVEQGVKEVFSALKDGMFPDPDADIYYNDRPVYFNDQ